MAETSISTRLKADNCLLEIKVSREKPRFFFGKFRLENAEHLSVDYRTIRATWTDKKIQSTMIHMNRIRTFEKKIVDVFS